MNIIILFHYEMKDYTKKRAEIFEILLPYNTFNRSNNGISREIEKLVDNKNLRFIPTQNGLYSLQFVGINKII